MNLIVLGKKIQAGINKRGRLFFSRRKAHSLRKKLIKEKNHQVVDNELKKDLKSYSKETFGNNAYWPWLALYTEIRGEFKPGWLPDDYYTVILLDEYCPEDARISNYKTFDHRLFPGFALEPLLVKVSGQFYDSNKRAQTIHEAQKVLNYYSKEVVIKEDSQLGGGSVKFIESTKIKLSDFSYLPNFIIQPLIKQHETLNRLSHNAVSTVRIITFLKDNGEIETKYSKFRFGVGDSRVDNTSAGGGFCFIDADGTLSEVAFDGGGTKMGNKHPDTGFEFKNTKIPNYDMILENCIKSHRIYPYVKIIGWDVTVNEKGDPVLLEWNADPGLWLSEALIGPRFANDF